MRYGINSPGFGQFADPRLLAELARLAEDAWWDGYFIWDHVYFGAPGAPPAPIGDPWVTLAAMAAATSRIRLGTHVTPLPRRRPWKLAREVVTLDHLSNGRFTLGLGIGEDRFGREYSAFGEPTDDRLHGEMLDEGIDVLRGLWSGEPFSCHGKHYHIDDVTFLPRPVQPTIPIWIGAWWPHKKPFRRAARCDGIAPIGAEGRLSPVDYRDILAYVAQFRESGLPFDVSRTAFLPEGSPAEAAAAIAEYEQAGVTWWLQPLEDDMGTLDDLRAIVRKGPPRS
ncbi:MAG TPA: TIGR03619 family F420-dependent LLM class oxidoreductase [Chloroflexia bacterium]|nr:TIGR03619 family F420-dependent LLM class oxidoreductase [Chloroflexia bacterium]